MPKLTTKTQSQIQRRAFRQPALRFSPTAWAKLLFLRDYGETEVGGFALVSADDWLYVEDVQLVRQRCTVITVAFDDDSVADFFDRCVDQGLKPAQFGRIWIHTHPGVSPEPSGTDEATFGRVFGTSDWALMFILACGGATYARLRFNVGPGGDVLLPVEVDYSRPFSASNWIAWEQEYLAHVQSAPSPSRIERDLVLELPEDPISLSRDYDGWLDAWQEYLDEGAVRYDECYF